MDLLKKIFGKKTKLSEIELTTVKHNGKYVHFVKTNGRGCDLSLIEELKKNNEYNLNITNNDRAHAVFKLTGEKNY